VDGRARGSGVHRPRRLPGAGETIYRATTIWKKNVILEFEAIDEGPSVGFAQRAGGVGLGARRDLRPRRPWRLAARTNGLSDLSYDGGPLCPGRMSLIIPAILAG